MRSLVPPWLVLNLHLVLPLSSRLYEGTLVHHLVHLMRTGGKLKHFLKSDSSSVKRYHSMLAVIQKLHTEEASMPSETQRRATAQQRERRQPLEDLTANLQQLFLLCEDDDEVRSVVRAQEDLHLRDVVSVKTRYRTKERHNRSNNPELSRKEECRGQDLL